MSELDEPLGVMDSCLSCGVEKAMAVKETYPHPDECLTQDVPIDPLLHLDCQPSSDDGKWRRVTVCHECFHRLDPDMWISENCWKSLDPKTPFKELPLLEDRSDS